MGFKQTAREFRDALDEFNERPFAFVKEGLVSDSA